MSKIKIALFMTMNQVMAKYSGILSLVKSLINDPDIDFKFLYTHNVPDSVKSFLEDYKDISVPYHCSLVTKNNNTFDYIITIDPYYGPHCKGSGYNNWTTKIIYKEYGVTGIDGSSYLYNTKIYNKAWRIITDTQETKNEIIRVTKRDPNTIIIGNPAFDYCPHSSESSHKNKTIIWSPHCSIIEDSNAKNIIGGRFSTFLTYKDAFTELIPKTFEDVNFVYKLHPVLGFRIDEAKRKGKIEESFNYEEWKEKVSNLSNVTISEDNNYHDLFTSSSLMLCDSISFMAEYLPTQNPIVVLRDSGSSNFSGYAEMLIHDSYYQAYSVDDIIALIRRLLEGADNENKLDYRSKYLKSYRPHYPESNSSYIIKYLKEVK